MARIKFSALITSLSGKLNGSVVKSCLSGSVMQGTMKYRVQSANASQLQLNRMSTARRNWVLLPESSKLAWLNSSYAGLSGYQLFISCQLNLLLTIGLPLSLPRLDLLPSFKSITTVSIIPATPLFRITLSGAVATGDRGIFYISKACSAGTSLDLRAMQFISNHNSTSGASLNLQLAYILKYGRVPQSGQKVFIKFVAVNLTSGLMSVPSFFSYIVP